MSCSHGANFLFYSCPAHLYDVIMSYQWGHTFLMMMIWWCSFIAGGQHKYDFCFLFYSSGNTIDPLLSHIWFPSWSLFWHNAHIIYPCMIWNIKIIWIFKSFRWSKHLFAYYGYYSFYYVLVGLPVSIFFTYWWITEHT